MRGKMREFHKNTAVYSFAKTTSLSWIRRFSSQQILWLGKIKETWLTFHCCSRKTPRISTSVNPLLSAIFWTGTAFVSHVPHILYMYRMERMLWWVSGFVCARKSHLCNCWDSRSLPTVVRQKVTYIELQWPRSLHCTLKKSCELLSTIVDEVVNWLLWNWSVQGLSMCALGTVAKELLKFAAYVRGWTE